MYPASSETTFVEQFAAGYCWLNGDGNPKKTWLFYTQDLSECCMITIECADYSGDKLNCF